MNHLVTLVLLALILPGCAGSREGSQHGAIRDLKKSPKASATRACHEGEYLDSKSSSCVPWTECGKEGIETAPGTSSMDRTCLPLHWVRSLGTEGIEISGSSAVDVHENVYWWVVTQGNLDGNREIGRFEPFLVKLDKVGRVIWTKNYPNPGSSRTNLCGVKSAPAGGVYRCTWNEPAIGGGEEKEVAGSVTRIDEEGRTLWTHDLGQYGEEIMGRISVDIEGNDYVVGQKIRNEKKGSCAFLTKINVAGEALWTQYFGEEGGDDASEIAVTAAGAIYVAGQTQDLKGAHLGTFYDIYVRKLDQEGSVSWALKVGKDDEMDYVRALATDKWGNVVVGSTLGDASVVFKLNPQGEELWRASIKGGRSTRASTVAIGAQGSVYVAGATELDLAKGHAGKKDVFIRKYDANGGILWTRLLGTKETDTVSSMLERDGTLFLSVTSYGSLIPEIANAGGPDAFMVKMKD